jgi:hypothetical protein
MTEKITKFDSGDVTDALASREKQYISFTYLPTKAEVRFKAFLTDFSDDYISNWNNMKVYGRMDPLVTFQGTERTITIGWDVPAFSAYEAYLNMQKVSLLLRMLYPVYENSSTGGGSQVLSGAPLFRMKFMNLADEFRRNGVSKKGLVGTVSGFTYSPDIDAGFYNADDGSLLEHLKKPDAVDNIFKDGAILPQSITLQCSYTVLHTEKLGWKNKNPANPNFPYNSPEKPHRTPAAEPAAPATEHPAVVEASAPGAPAAPPPAEFPDAPVATGGPGATITAGAMGGVTAPRGDPVRAPYFWPDADGASDL